MKILISYHNFVRDFRGSLLLKYTLEALGHQVWVRPHWYDELFFATVKAVDAIVYCQIAEQSTSRIAEFTSKHGIHLIINSSEPLATPEWFETLVTYDVDKLSDSVISLQSIASPELKSYIDQHPGLKYPDKYKLLGFPRLDIALDSQLRDVENDHFERTYDLRRFKKRLLYVSSLTFEETFSDVPKGDMEKWKYNQVIDTNHALLRFHQPILEGLLEKYLGADGVLLIKKHPWDMSDQLERKLSHPNVRFVNHAEYIVPCLACSDSVIYCNSTSAIEAWILGKPTISLIPEQDRPRLSLNHMRDEIFAGSLDETISLLECYPRTDLPKSVQKALGKYADGKATIRLAKEIHKLRPKQEKNLKRRNISRYRLLRELRWWLEDRGIRPYEFDLNGKNTKMRRLADWEHLRLGVTARYRAAFRGYIARHKGELVR